MVLFALAVPVLANRLRALGTIWWAQNAGVEAATGCDHLVYGWFFFAAVIALTLGAAWPFFDRSPTERPQAPPALPAQPHSPVPVAIALAVMAALPASGSARRRLHNPRPHSLRHPFLAGRA